MEIKTVLMKQDVKVRKHSIDKDAINELLRSHKKTTNKQIAKALNVPVTMVEHWFRKDSCFQVPNAEVWQSVKDLLGIMTDEYDKQIMEYETREGVYEKSERVYLTHGIAPTITATNGEEKIVQIRPMQVMKTIVINAMDDGTCRTIKSQYHQTSAANFTYTSTFGATGVMRIVNIKEATKQGYAPCKVGGGGRPVIPNEQNEKRESDKYG